MAKRQAAGPEQMSRIEGGPAFGYRALPASPTKCSTRAATSGRYGSDCSARSAAWTRRILPTASPRGPVPARCRSLLSRLPARRIPNAAGRFRTFRVDRRGGMGHRFRPASSSVPNCSSGVLADVYGENRLVKAGLLPPALIASNPEFLRPMVGLEPANDIFCTSAPSRRTRPRGNGGAFRPDEAPSRRPLWAENGVATTRAFRLYAEAMSILGWISSGFRDTLQGHKQHADDRLPCSRRASPTRPISSMPTLPAISVSCCSRARI